MKLFIWEDVLCDYTAGMAVAYAETLEEAMAEFPVYVAEQLGPPTIVVDCGKQTKPACHFVYGGG